MPVKLPLPNTIVDQFIAAGWFAGRHVHVEKPHQNYGDYACAILNEFGGLHVGKCDAGRDLATSDIRFLSEPHPGKDAVVEQWIARVGNLYAIADSHHGHMMVFVSEDGKVYFFTDPDEKLYLGGHCFGEAMERLLLGIEYGPAIE